jgi:hypothetical protein
MLDQSQDINNRRTNALTKANSCEDGEDEVEAHNLHQCK